MKNTFFILFWICFISAESAAQPIPAFPGAEGWGMFSRGGRNGAVIEVTNLNDSGDGSLRAAIENPNPRTVVFRVSGYIELKSMLEIKSPYITIAGQTAPGDGISLKNYPLHIIDTHDVIIRCIRIRPGIGSGERGSELDGIEVRNASNIIIDHCTVNFTNDEGINNWHNSSFVTFQWCIIAEPLNKSVHEKGAHGYGASIGGYKTSFHHNIIANSVARMPSIAGNNQNPTVMLDVRNCVFSNWGHRSCDGKPLSINLVNNYFKPGPATKPDVRRRIARIDNAENQGFTCLWHIYGNEIEASPDISTNNWNGGVDYESGTSEARNRSINPFEYQYVTTQSAKEAYELVLKNAGVVTPKRDSHENRIINQIRSNTFSYGNNGIIDSVEDVGGWNKPERATPLSDSDHDGIPDEWETANGLNPNNFYDSATTDDFGYTYLEKYINDLVTNPYKYTAQ
jgi:pectate lyase